MNTRLSAKFGRVAILVLSSWTASAHAKDLYRWVDEKGTTQISDTVPPQYRKNAKRIDTSASRVSESDRAQAAERASREKAAAERSSAPPAAPRATEPVAANRPAATISGARQTQCEQLRRAYAESQACFSSYGTANGAVRAEAYQHCTQVPDPSPSCGIPSN
jgi:hypothetical protein